LLNDSDRRVLLRTGIIVDVDHLRHVATVQFQEDEAPGEEIRLSASYVSKRGGAWMGAMPERGDLAILAKVREEQDYFIIGYLPYPPIQNTEEDELDELGSRDDFRVDRPAAAPGDLFVAAATGNYVSVRRGGAIEIHADDLCHQTFFRDERAIRTFCEQFLVEGFFGFSEHFTHREPARDEAGRTPTGHRTGIKSHAQHAPHVFVDSGAVLEEETLRLPGPPPLGKDTFGKGICLRVLVFDQAFANNEARSGISPPDPRKAKFSLRIDQAGNVAVHLAGQWTQTMRDRTSLVRGRDIQQSGRLHMFTDKGSIALHSAANFRMAAKRDMHLHARGDMHIKCKRLKLEAATQNLHFKGEYSVSADGGFRVEGAAGRIDAAGDLGIVAGGSRSDFVGDRYSLIVGGKGVLENIGRDVISHKTVVRSGKYAVRVTSGSMEISVGPETAPLASIRIHNDLVKGAPYVGTIELSTITGTRMELRPDGSWAIGNNLGKIQGDQTGRIQMGPGIAPAGYLVTTMSHLDYVTGLPLGGNPHLSATQLLPPVPSPVALPNLGPQPPFLPVPLPDEPEFT
jgi:hypothetical protein